MMQTATILRLVHNASLLALTLYVSAFSLPTAASSQDTPAASKEALIETLDKVLPLLASKDFEKAAEYFVLPENFEPEMLDGFIDRRELSLSGIRILEQDATFGPATEVFSAERAQAFAARAGVDVATCFGFNHETQSATAEVLATWANGRFKLVRLDDVGKLQPQERPTTQPPMTKEEILLKLSGLEEAVQTNPNDIAARANYAMALNQLGNLPAAWTQLMAAFQLSPSHGGIAKGIEAVWAQFAQQGLFTVGIPAASVEGLLGKPSQTIALKSGPRWVYGFYAIDFDAAGLHETIDLRGASEALFRPTEIVSVDLDGRGWRVGSRTKSANHSTALLYIPGENTANWNEQIEIQRILGGAATGTPRDIAEKMATQIKAAVPQSQTKILISTDDSVTIAVTLTAPQTGESRHQLIRLFLGPTDVHRLAYTVKGAEPSRETQMKWFEIFQAAQLESVEPATKASSDGK
jgi:hypothetical protein